MANQCTPKSRKLWIADEMTFRHSLAECLELSGILKTVPLEGDPNSETPYWKNGASISRRDGSHYHACDLCARTLFRDWLGKYLQNSHATQLKEQTFLHKFSRLIPNR